MSLDLDQIEVVANRELESWDNEIIQEKYRTILLLISELREYKAANKTLQLQVQLADIGRPSDLIFEGLKERLQSAEEALSFYCEVCADIPPTDCECSVCIRSEIAIDHFETFK